MTGRGLRVRLAAVSAVLAIVLNATGCIVVRPTPGGGGTPLPSSVSGYRAGTGQLPTPGLPDAENVKQVAFHEQVPVAPGAVANLPPLTGPTAAAPGCAPGLCSNTPAAGCDPGPMPSEKAMVTHPMYTVAAPDILFIDAVRLVPRPPYRIEALESLLIQVTDTLPNQPISGAYTVSPDGTVNLGYAYGAVRVAGLTLDQVQTAIRTHLGMSLRNPQVNVALAQLRGLQQTRGEHLIRQDGTISLGTYGCVYVAGMTLAQVKCAVEKHLSQWLLNPEISVDVFAYNSKRYYVIVDGGGYGQQVLPFPVTGNETVLDAIANIQGLAPVSSKHRIWIARPAPCGNGCSQILPVDWRSITEGGVTCTNYQLFPGDRVFVDADCLIAADNWLAKILAPVERVLGITLLGSSTVNSIRNTGNGNGGGFFFVP